MLLHEYANFNSIAEKLCESSRTNPVNRYGKQKVEAEKIVLSTDSNNLVIRTSVGISHLLTGLYVVFINYVTPPPIM